MKNDYSNILGIGLLAMGFLLQMVDIIKEK